MPGRPVQCHPQVERFGHRSIGAIGRHEGDHAAAIDLRHDEEPGAIRCPSQQPKALELVVGRCPACLEASGAQVMWTLLGPSLNAVAYARRVPSGDHVRFDDDGIGEEPERASAGRGIELVDMSFVRLERDDAIAPGSMATPAGIIVGRVRNGSARSAPRSKVTATSTSRRGGISIGRRRVIVTGSHLSRNVHAGRCRCRAVRARRSRHVGRRSLASEVRQVVVEMSFEPAARDHVERLATVSVGPDGHRLGGGPHDLQRPAQSGLGRAELDTKGIGGLRHARAPGSGAGSRVPEHPAGVARAPDPAGPGLPPRPRSPRSTARHRIRARSRAPAAVDALRRRCMRASRVDRARRRTAPGRAGLGGPARPA